MLADIAAQMLSVLVVNWFYIAAIQFIVFFRQTIREFLKQIANITYGIVSGIFSAVFFIIFIFISLAYLFGKSGSVTLSYYGIEHLYPVILVLCLEFAEFLVLICKYKLGNSESLLEVTGVLTEYEIMEESNVLSEFVKPNMAFLQ